MKIFHRLDLQKRLRLALTIAAGLVILPVASMVITGGQDTATGATNGRVAFTKNDGTSYQIYTSKPDGTDVQALTNDASNSQMASWSADGTQLIYVADPNNDGMSQLFRMNADGSGKTQLTSDANPKLEPQWSPDGTKVVYTVADPNTYSLHLFRANADGSNPVQLTTGDGEMSASWKPDGTRLAYSCYDSQGDPNLCTINPDGTGQVTVTSGSITYMYPSWSPDGSKLAIIYEPSNYDSQLAVMNADGSGLQAIATGDGNNMTPSWSPDGTKILYTNYDATGGDASYRVYSVNANGSGKFAITANDGNGTIYPAWQPVVSADMDNDGALNTAEKAGPNNGDANGDGVADDHQATVTSFLNSVSGTYTALQSTCNANSGVSATALPAGYADPAFTYPAGLLSFTLACGSAGATATVSQYYYGVTASSTFVLRKYNTASHAYTTMPGVTLSTVTIGGQTVTKASYAITDGGAFDQDGAANGTIVDPVGLARPAIGVPNTGIGGMAYGLE